MAINFKEIASFPIQITAEMLKLIAEIDEFKGSWKAYKNLAPDRLAALRWVATVESVASSTRIEGVKLSDAEVEKLLGNLEQKQFATRDEQEVAGYAAAMQLIYESFDAVLPTENHLKQLHSILLKYSDKDVRHRGEYKTLPNHVEAFGPDGKSLGVVFETVTPFDTPRAMEEIILWVHEALSTQAHHPLVIIGIFIVCFLAIHPFQDGNGRLSRILTALLLLRSGYSYVPYVSLESLMEQNKDNYYLALRRSQTTLKSNSPEWEPWLMFFLKMLQKQKNNLFHKIEREQLILQSHSRLSADLLQIIQERGRATIGELLVITKANRATVKVHLANLVKQGQLMKHGQGRGVWYGRKP